MPDTALGHHAGILPLTGPEGHHVPRPSIQHSAVSVHGMAPEIISSPPSRPESGG